MAGQKRKALVLADVVLAAKAVLALMRIVREEVAAIKPLRV
jgi:hypothetical protein